MNKYIKYLNYVLRHKWYVFVECCRFGVPIRGLLHDNSKFRPSELIPYARYFYKKPGEYQSLKEYGSILTKLSLEEVEAAFDKAWLLHIHRNPHHWQYWLLREDSGANKTIRIPEKYLKEMVADWIGAGKAITGKRDIGEWYRKSRDKIEISKNQKRYVENIIWPCKDIPGTHKIEDKE